MKFLKRKPAEKWLTYAAILVTVLAVTVAIAFQHSRNAAADKAERSHQAVDTGATFEPTDAEAKPLKIGSVAKIGPDYSVAVSKVTLHEGTDTPFLVVAVKAKNIGRDVSHPAADLAVGFSKASLPKSDESTCQVDLGKLKASDKTALPVGDVKSFAVCINLPTPVLDHGWVSVEAHGTGERASWTTSGRVPKVISTIKPDIHIVAPVPGAPGTTAELPKKFNKNLKKAKKARDTLEDQIKAYKKLPDYKKKKLKKLKKQLDYLDEVIDQMEKIKDQVE
jgi:hypothetical protein